MISVYLDYFKAKWEIFSYFVALSQYINVEEIITTFDLCPTLGALCRALLNKVAAVANYYRHLTRFFS